MAALAAGNRLGILGVHAVTLAELNPSHLAQLFRKLGLRSGDSIALMMENHPRFFEICWAAQRSGLIYTTVSSRLTTPEVEYIVRDSGAQVLVTSHAMRDVAAELVGPLSDLRARFAVGGPVDDY